MAEDKVFELGNDKRVTVREFKGRTLIDIRAFYEKDGKKLPGSKGISLTEGQFEELTTQLQDIQAAIESMKEEKQKDRGDKKGETATNDKKRKAEEESAKGKEETSDKKPRGKKILSEEFITKEDDDDL
ncbi:RNA polymerase II transcriptional coactivator KELP [Yarrowia sp. C11]|nr:RNA polymerase II transcriptional coactivator KELP [Yarrowia sp. C11]KAG5370990.1 RNA polymerase II transcriptional coactivator KELP [Yarrowia sp. E02]